MSTSQQPSRVIRDRKLTSAEARRYAELRTQINRDKPEILSRIKARQAVGELLSSLKVAREQSGLSLQDVTDRSGMDRSAVAKLENGLRENPTLETLYRYAAALGKRLHVTIDD